MASAGALEALGRRFESYSPEWVHGAAASIPACHAGGDSSILSDPVGLVAQR